MWQNICILNVNLLSTTKLPTNNYLATTHRGIISQTCCNKIKTFLHPQRRHDQQANAEKPATLLQNTTSVAPSVGTVGHSLEWLQAEQESAAANCVDSPGELSSQSRLTTAQLSRQNKNNVHVILPYLQLHHTQPSPPASHLKHAAAKYLSLWHTDWFLVPVSGIRQLVLKTGQCVMYFWC